MLCLIYDIECILAKLIKKQEVNKVMCDSSDYMDMVYLYKLKSPYDSVYIYVFSDWNDAYNKWVDWVTFNTFCWSNLKPYDTLRPRMRLSDNVQVTHKGASRWQLSRCHTEVLGLPIVNLSWQCQKWLHLKLRTGPIDVCKRNTERFGFVQMTQI